MTDFYSQNRCVCSTRSHGPLLCAFCLSFHFNHHTSSYVQFAPRNPVHDSSSTFIRIINIAEWKERLN